ncbi:DNA repair endonuclease XPF-like isoform X2 [Tubulanus polymorphus]|uniref:DNA repair endonuclease XPF-like isoform X2 n=1 Tax=Tubulanus polymorphus TaxID=672921 RepID=UPI003DA36B9E
MNTAQMKEGGVLFVTSRILVVDILTDRLPTELVTGIIVYKAHRIIESCQEAFILRMYRQKNRQGFIKAFSDQPNAFTTGFCHVERVMKNMFIKKLFLWPRFQANVVSSLEQHKAEVVELHVHMTSAMTACQASILDLINACVKELVRNNPSIDTDEITVENAMTKNFDQAIRMNLEPVWHQLGQKTKQLVGDLKTLRLLLEHLTHHDCVTFYSLVNSIRTSEKRFGTNAGWLFLDSADSLFVHAAERVYGPKPKLKPMDEESKQSKRLPVLEECPKWQVLSDILKEIREENDSCGPELGQGSVLIAADDDRTCNQIKEYLTSGGKELLNRLYEKHIATKMNQAEPETKKGKRAMKKREVEKKSSKAKRRKVDEQEPKEITLTQLMGNCEKSDEDDIHEDKAGPSTDAYCGFINEPMTVLHPLRGGNEQFGLYNTLQEIKPRYVILYDAAMPFVRQLEVYKACNPCRQLRVYFIMYTASTEEQKYLTTLRKEKQAFEYLIREKASMVIPEDREGKVDDDPSLARGSKPANATVNTRKGGLTQPEVQHKIIVDMREFRSELPSLIHRRGIDIEPLTIEVGDYILTPDMCVERKSVSDLIGSLNNGRLYNQCVAMTRYYNKPILLIEFDQNKAFSLYQSKYGVTEDYGQDDVLSKLTLLTMHFPNLRILWCVSPYATAELFEELKEGKEQPDPAKALAVTGDAVGSESLSDKYNHGPQDMLLKMPGINSKNYFLIMDNVKDMAELVTLTEAELSAILKSSINAKLLWDFLNRKENNLNINKHQQKGKKKR